MKRSLTFAAIASVLALGSGAAHGSRGVTGTDSFVVIAHIDAGINPYHEVFRDHGPLAFVHPSTYIPGYPANTPALNLTLDKPTWQEDFQADKAIWDNLLTHPLAALKMYWIPGTKIIGAIRKSPGGLYCPVVQEVQPPPAAGLVSRDDCTDYPILDDHGHGTMTATRMGGNQGSLCPECRIVSIEGLGDAGVKWAADQGWIDVQTNSWGYLFPPQPVFSVTSPTAERNLEEAAQKTLTYFASGNGAGFFLGWTTWPTEIAPTLVKGAIWVGADDNGKVAEWSGAPAHLVADGYGGLAAGNRSILGIAPSPFACCTSAASPYAAGEGAAIILEARKILGDTRTGIRNGVVAEGTPPAGLTRGPLVDGKLTLDELRALVKHTAQARPQEGRDDGKTHWAGRGSAPAADDFLPYGPGGNAFCMGCWTLPVKWTDIPAGVPVYPLIGYGAANEFSLALAKSVLAGTAAEPNRSDVDEFFANEAMVRNAIHHPLP